MQRPSTSWQRIAKDLWGRLVERWKEHIKQTANSEYQRVKYAHDSFMMNVMVGNDECRMMSHGWQVLKTLFARLRMKLLLPGDSGKLSPGQLGRHLN
jgi:hypothetical protein